MESPRISPPVDDIIHEEALSLLKLMKTQKVVFGVMIESLLYSCSAKPFFSKSFVSTESVWGRA